MPAIEDRKSSGLYVEETSPETGREEAVKKREEEEEDGNGSRRGEESQGLEVENSKIEKVEPLEKGVTKNQQESETRCNSAVIPPINGELG